MTGAPEVVLLASVGLWSWKYVPPATDGVGVPTTRLNAAE
jgi:hypothetical protein